MNPYEKQQLQHDNRPPVLPQPKSQLFYSKYCKFSNELLSKIQKLGQENRFDFISIDNRFVKDNITYVRIMNNQQAMPLPPMINRVPSLLLVPNYEVLVGEQIMEYIKPTARNVKEERNNINMEPNPFSLNNESIGSFGVASDTYSFLDSSSEELGAAGNAGCRQMYNYAEASGITTSNIKNPTKNDRENKMNMSMEEIQSRRNTELSY